MTITERAPVVKAEAAPVSPWRRWLAPVSFAVFGLVDIFVFGLLAHHGDVTFAFSQPFAKVTIPNLSLPAAETCYAAGALTLVLAVLRAVVKMSTLWPASSLDLRRRISRCSLSSCLGSNFLASSRKFAN